MKISVITAVFNRVHTLPQALASLHTQTYTAVEHVIIDGASTDGTAELVSRLASANTIVLSESDRGIYDALNKGFALATGEVLGVLHSDDYYADDSVLSRVADEFLDPEVDLVYGDLDYVDAQSTSRIVRRWRSGPYEPKRLAWGWMPAHPTMFVRRRVVEELGAFDTRFRIAADYDAVLRYFSSPTIRSSYIPRVLVKMRTGGISNQSLGSIFRKSVEDYVVLRRHRIGGFRALAWKNIGKLPQLF